MKSYFPVNLLVLSTLAATTHAEGCNYANTCINRYATYAPCSPEDDAEFDLVQPSLQACEDISYFFIYGERWPVNDRALYCDVNSPCGAIVPYIRHVRADKICGRFGTFANMIVTFDYFCTNEPVGLLPGDNGLLASLKNTSNKTPKPTPARTKPTDFETPEPIPNDPTPTPAATKTTTPTPTVRGDTPAPTVKDNKADANSKTASASGSNSLPIKLFALCVIAAGEVAL